MYQNTRHAIEGSQRWFKMAIRYQTKAQKLVKRYSGASLYPSSIFACYRGYARCMQMYEACWAYVNRCNEQYIKERRNRQLQEERKENERIRQRMAADAQAEKDAKFVYGIGYLAAAVIGILFADVWISFIKWLAPLLI